MSRDALITMGHHSPVRKLDAWGRLVRSQCLRAGSHWLFPVYLFLAWYASRDPNLRDVMLWVRASAGIGLAAILIAPVAAGTAAWIATRNERHGPIQLLSLMPTRLPHDLAAISGLIAWSGLAYGLNACIQSAIAYRSAVWGAIDFAPIVIGFMTIVVAVCIGYAVGAALPSLFVPPLMAIAVFTLLVVPYGALSLYSAQREFASFRYLTPYSFLNLSDQVVYFRPWRHVFWLLFGWLSGLALVVLAGIVFRAQHRVCAGLLAVVGLILGIGGGAGLSTLPAVILDVPGGAVPYQPVCMSQAVEVCVHPAYRNKLAPTVTIATAVFQPVADLPGIPTRLEQFAPRRYTALPPGTADTQLESRANGPAWLAMQYAFLIVEGRPQGMPNYPGLSSGQSVVARWLLRQAGFAYRNPGGRTTLMPRVGYSTQEEYARLDAQIDEAVDRFDQLTDSERRKWLADNMERLRVGALQLDEMP
jgi:hypothetical protein